LARLFIQTIAGDIALWIDDPDKQ